MIEGTVVVSDLHCPHHDEYALDTLYQFCKDRKPKNILYIGDVLDLSGSSRHSTDNMIERTEQTVLDALRGFGSVHDRFYKICPRSRFRLAAGNHDERLKRHVEKNPEWRRICDDIVQLLAAFGKSEHAHKIELHHWDDPEEEVAIGRMNFVHGHYAGKHCAAQHVESFGECVTFGHAHTQQMFTAVRKGKPVAGYCVGHLSNKEARRYLKGKYHRWVTGFGYMEHDTDTGLFTMHLLPIVDGQFIFAGKKYKSRKKAA